MNLCATPVYILGQQFPSRGLLVQNQCMRQDGRGRSLIEIYWSRYEYASGLPITLRLWQAWTTSSTYPDFHCYRRLIAALR
jgi:hypothetical protein